MIEYQCYSTLITKGFDIMLFKNKNSKMQSLYKSFQLTSSCIRVLLSKISKIDDTSETLHVY